MVIKYQDGAVRLWEGKAKKTDNYNIGIRFDKKKVNPAKAAEVYDEVQRLLAIKFGVGI